MTVETTNQPGEVLPRGLPGLDVVEDWLKAGIAVDKLVRPLIASDFIPKTFRPEIPRNADPDERQRAYDTTLGNAIAAVMFGMSLGLDPLVSLQQIYVVHGKPGMYTRMKVALAQAAGHEVWDEAFSAERAVVIGRRKGWPADGSRDVRIEITIEMARTAGWTKNDTYTKTPADMLWNRAAARVVDRIAADLLHGIQSIEDIEPDEPVRATTPITAQDIRARVGSGPQSTIHALGRTTAATETGNSATMTTVVERSSPEQPEPAPEQQAADLCAADELIDLQQNRRLHGLLRKLDLGHPGDREAALAVISFLIERPVESTKLLTKAETGPLLERLQALTEKDEPDWREEIRLMVTGQLPAPEGGADRG